MYLRGHEVVKRTPEREALYGVLNEISFLLTRIQGQGDWNANASTITKLRIVRGQLMNIADGKVK